MVLKEGFKQLNSDPCTELWTAIAAVYIYDILTTEDKPAFMDTL